MVPRNQHPLVPQPACGLGQDSGAVLEPFGKKLALGPLLAGRAPGRASPSVSWLSEWAAGRVIDLPPLGGPGHKSHRPSGVT